MTASRPRARRRTACMLTAQVNFVMSSVGFLSVGLCPRHQGSFQAMIAGNSQPSCKMHYPKMPSLQIATSRQHRTYITI
jgi:hypothetical protein